MTQAESMVLTVLVRMIFWFGLYLLAVAPNTISGISVLTISTVVLARPMLPLYLLKTNRVILYVASTARVKASAGIEATLVEAPSRVSGQASP